jgi:hypothetical protein
VKSVLLSAALAIGILAGPARADDGLELLRLDREISVATWTADGLWFEENLADDFVLVMPDGAIRGKREVIRDLATPGLEMEPFDPTDVRVRVYGDTAVVTGRMLQRFVLGGVRRAHDLRYTDVYVRRKGRWLLVSGHVSPVK